MVHHTASEEAVLSTARENGGGWTELERMMMARDSRTDWQKRKRGAVEYQPEIVEGVDPRLPFETDCSCETIPPEIGVGEAGVPKGKRKVKVPNLPTITKIFFDRYRADIFRTLDELAGYGVIQKTIGFDFLDRQFSKYNCTFDLPSYYKIDREHFYAELPITLLLRVMNRGVQKWRGSLKLRFDFSGNNRKFKFGGLGTGTLADCNLTPLDKYLIPVLKNHDVDEIGESMWLKYYPEAYYNRNLRSARALAECMGLSIKYLPLYKDENTNSCIFFNKCEILAKDNLPLDDAEPQHVVISAGTIVINTNCIKRVEHSEFHIYHECFHYENHYLFYASQKLACSDIKEIPTKTLIVGEFEEVKDPLYFVEKQADRGAFALMMPRTETVRMIEEYTNRVTGYSHLGQLYDRIGMSIVRKTSLPEFRVRARMIQLGHIVAKCCMNWRDGRRLQPYFCDPKVLQDPRVTYNIGKQMLNKLCYKNPEFFEIMASGRYVHADGHVVRNDPRFIKRTQDGFMLTNEALAHLDRCCMRFMQIYIRNDNGQYVLGRLNYDREYMERLNFYLEDIMKERKVNDLEAEEIFIREFPDNFEEAFDKLMRKNGETRESMADKLRVGVRSLDRWLARPSRFINYDFIILLMLHWKLPDFIFDFLLDTAEVYRNKKNPRHRAFERIRRVNWNDGCVDKANEYLIECRLPMLSVSE